MRPGKAIGRMEIWESLRFKIHVDQHYKEPVNGKSDKCMKEVLPEAETAVE